MELAEQTLKAYRMSKLMKPHYEVIGNACTGGFYGQLVYLVDILAKGDAQVAGAVMRLISDADFNDHDLPRLFQMAREGIAPNSDRPAVMNARSRGRRGTGRRGG